ncbi:helix-turn-helix domain-containing protein [Synechocystis salina LEGE 06099]|uniref:helix-turn-helix domain-containing protein n=1 Tax=Synechocystis salina TaxID=945780 RepID=UPI00187E6B01|nr:helix-turn-helix domain-containing protein [Synechocystis salina]MBE9204155.1 helix-turn-helix domain-containing protein [Synechocystis salina LEGE 06099]
MPNSVPAIAYNQFSSIEALESAYCNTSSFRVVQLEKGTLDCRIYRLVLEHGIFEFRQLETPLRIWGEKSSENITFELVLSPICGDYLSHGFRIINNTLYGFDSNRNIDLRLPKNLLMGTLIIKKKFFQNYLKLMAREDIDQSLLSSNYLQIGNQFDILQTYLLELYGLVKTRANFLNQAKINKLLLEDYLPLLITAIPPTNCHYSSSLKYSHRWKLVKQVESHLLNHLDQPITLKELCEKFYITKTPLNYAFQEMLGLSPLAYLKLLRLHAIHRVLKSADPETRITSLMHQFGFWHAGRFSMDYKKLFGESPSETLKK